jgi:hypothetical protein
MISQRDSELNKQMSFSNSEIALATKADGAAMKTISLVTLTFLPATFVTVCCSSLLDLPFDLRTSSNVQLVGTSRYELLYR